MGLFSRKPKRPQLQEVQSKNSIANYGVDQDMPVAGEYFVLQRLTKYQEVLKRIYKSRTNKRKSWMGYVQMQVTEDGKGIQVLLGDVEIGMFATSMMRNNNHEPVLESVEKKIKKYRATIADEEGTYRLKVFCPLNP